MLKKKVSMATGSAPQGVSEQLIMVPRALTDDGENPRKGNKATTTKLYEARYKGIISR